MDMFLILFIILLVLGAVLSTLGFVKSSTPLLVLGGFMVGFAIPQVLRMTL